jgi:hypothetical protein
MVLNISDGIRNQRDENTFYGNKVRLADSIHQKWFMGTLNTKKFL